MSPFKHASRFLVIITISLATLSSASALTSESNPSVEPGPVSGSVEESSPWGDWPPFFKSNYISKSVSKKYSSGARAAGTRDENGGEGTRLELGGEGTRSEIDESALKYLLGGEGTRLEVGGLEILVGHPKWNSGEADIGKIYFLVAGTNQAPRTVLKMLLPHLWYNVFDVAPPALLMPTKIATDCTRQLVGDIRNFTIAESESGYVKARVTADGQFEQDSCSGARSRNHQRYDLLVNFNPENGIGSVLFNNADGN